MFKKSAQPVIRILGEANYEKLLPAAAWKNAWPSVCVLSDEEGCPPGQEFEVCANQCPQRCSDLQQGIECQGNTECQPGCRCPKGTEATVIIIIKRYVSVWVCAWVCVCPLSEWFFPESSSVRWYSADKHMCVFVCICVCRWRGDFYFNVVNHSANQINYLNVENSFSCFNSLFNRCILILFAVNAFYFVWVSASF